eukprot:248293_1
MATTLQIVNIVVSCVTVITGCLMICWLLTFHYLTHISAISQRRPNTTLFIGILQIVGSLLAYNVQLIFLHTFRTSIYYSSSWCVVPHPVHIIF